MSVVDYREYWSFGHQIGSPVNFVADPGDRINVHCVYDTTKRNTTTKFGFDSQLEMCVAFLFYYPYDDVVGSINMCGTYKTPKKYTICGRPFKGIYDKNIADKTLNVTHAISSSLGRYDGMNTRIEKSLINNRARLSSIVAQNETVSSNWFLSFFKLPVTIITVVVIILAIIRRQSVSNNSRKKITLTSVNKYDDDREARTPLTVNR